MLKSTESLSSAYNPKEVETKWYAFWEKQGFFSPEPETRNPKLETFTIVIPPPNVTGSLHMGHALQHSVHDCLVRWNRMRGKFTLCVPGTDHASIAVHAKIEEQLLTEGIRSRHELGREKFIERAWVWREHYGNIILKQMRLLGCSYDWSRERFTMDDHYYRAVQKVFVEWFNKGWVYRGYRIINWCPRCQTSLSDLEAPMTEQPGKLWHIRYPFADGHKGSIIVATTRPETMLGDIAVAVNPSDERYKDLIGKTVMLPLMNREIPIIADEFVDASFGTGAVKVTPAHDPNDFDMGQRHNLPLLLVIGKDARMTDEAKHYAGLDRYEAREKIVSDLESQGLLAQVEDYPDAKVPRCARCATVLEPLPLEQWFVNMKPMADRAVEAIEHGRVRYVPERYTEIALEWLRNIRDWNISRQLWWGQRIPAWQCENGHWTVRLDAPTKCVQCGSEKLEQDPDVFDTWFSSGIWPQTVLGWPDDAPELKKFFPTNLLITDRQILHLWVARMIMSALDFLNEVPFHEVYVHATILNLEGKRMSKSLGTGVDPLELMEKYGTDATRFGLILNCTKGQDVRFSERQIQNTRNFCTKLWNASRFVMMNLEERGQGAGKEEKNNQPLHAARCTLHPETGTLSVPDKWILSRCNKTIREVTEHLEKFNFHEACQTLYEFLWGDFCDWYLEIAKIDLYEEGFKGSRVQGFKGDKGTDAGSDPDTAQSKKGSDPTCESRKMVVQGILHHTLSQTLKLLHPFLPFITEEIYTLLNPQEKSIMIAAWPVADEGLFDEYAENEMRVVQNIVSTLRSLRHELSISPSEKVEANILQPDTPPTEKFKKVERSREVVKFLAKLNRFDHGNSLGPSQQRQRLLSSLVDGIEVSIPIPENFNIKNAMLKLEKEKTKLEQEAAKLQKRLTDGAFLKGAPPHVLESEKGKAQNYEKQLAHIQERLHQFKSFEVTS